MNALALQQVQNNKINRYRKSLKDYCAVDTIGMVEIVKKLRQIIQ